ncbi:MAG: hypothetical protein LBU34_00595 [Planctomycetaceae bacterium]|jgi:hypothetical protein|nr:hypothetical protein [Planctomycetaceae bacterium]
MKKLQTILYVTSIVIALGMVVHVDAPHEGALPDEVGAVQCPNKEVSNACQLGSLSCPGSYSSKGDGNSAYMVKLAVSDQMKQCYQSNASCNLHDAYSVDTNCE